jgi:tripartite-type tricarboxylate transporter receptor subunit TctC
MPARLTNTSCAASLFPLIIGPPMRKLVLAVLLAFPLFAEAQYPAKPLRAVVAFGTGGTTDVTARIIAAALQQSLGQPVVIDNKPGADGIVAGQDVVRSAPDGYTIWFATYTQISALPSLRKNVPFDPMADFTPIGSIGNFSFFWAVNPELPIKSLKELAAYGRANPGKLNAGSSGAAATMAPTLFARAEKFDLQVVAYKSETTALNDLVTGRIQLMLASGTLAQHLRDGRARGIATLNKERSKALPDLPTMTEAGVAPFPAVPWMGLFGPAKMPREIVERLSRELLAVLKNPEVRERVERQAIELNPLPPEAIAALAKEQIEVWRRITKEAGYTPE